jgi:glutathione synthase/RimK-type ligase-like ATP-grasp enzyme
VRRRGRPGKRALALLRVGLATCAEIPELDADDEPLLPALRARSIDPRAAIWDAPDVDWSTFDLVVVRSTWDYAERRRDFLAWARSLPRVLNPPAVLEWSTDKERYLPALAAAGVPVVPTSFVRPGDPFAPPESDFVVKPAVSAGGRSSARFRGGDGRAAAALVRRIHESGRTAMVQPDLGDETETAVVHVDGRYSHAVRRRVPLPSAEAQEVLYLEEEVEPGGAGPADRELAERAIAAAPGPVLYGRVDIAAGCVVELELAEPSLYLSFAAGGEATERFADAIAREAATSQRLRISPENRPTTSQ